VNSPATDSTYKPNPDFPNFQFYTTFRITFKPEAFGESGFGMIRMTSVHASPAKTPNDTIQVQEKPGPVPGSADDPFRYYNPVPGGGTTNPPNDPPNDPPGGGDPPIFG